MDWAHLFPRLRQTLDHLCALREDVWPGNAETECRMMKAWAAL